MNTNTRIIGQWVLIDNCLVWQWTAIKPDNLLELRMEAIVHRKAA